LLEVLAQNLQELNASTFVEAYDNLDEPFERVNATLEDNSQKASRMIEEFEDLRSRHFEELGSAPPRKYQKYITKLSTSKVRDNEMFRDINYIYYQINYTNVDNLDRLLASARRELQQRQEVGQDFVHVAGADDGSDSQGSV